MNNVPLSICLKVAQQHIYSIDSIYNVCEPVTKQQHNTRTRMAYQSIKQQPEMTGCISYETIILMA